ELAGKRGRELDMCELVEVHARRLRRVIRAAARDDVDTATGCDRVRAHRAEAIDGGAELAHLFGLEHRVEEADGVAIDRVARHGEEVREEGPLRRAERLAGGGRE